MQFLNSGRTIQELLLIYQQEPDRSILEYAYLLILSGENEKAVELLDKHIGSNENKSYFHLLTAIAYYESGNISQGSLILDNLNLDKRGSYPEYVLQQLYKAKIRHNAGAYTTVVSQLEKIVVKSEKKLPIFITVAIYNTLSKSYINLGDYEQALKHMIAVLNMDRRSIDPVSLATSYNHLGTVYSRLNDVEKSKHYHLLSLELRNKIGYPEGVAKSSKNLSLLYLQEGQIDSSLYAATESLNICQTLDYRKGIAKSKLVLAEIAMRNEAYEDVEQHLEEAFNIAASTGYIKGQAKALFELGQMKNLRKDYKASLHYYMASLNLFRKASILDGEEQVLLEISNVYKMHGVLDSALQYYVKYDSISRQRIAQIQSVEVNHLQNEITIREQELENQLLRRANKEKKQKIDRKEAEFSRAMLFASMLIMLLIFSAVLVFRLRRKKNELNQLNINLLEQGHKLDQSNSELSAALKDKINLMGVIGHEVRNPLWWFRELAHKLNADYDKMDPVVLSKSLSAMDESAQTVFHLADNLIKWSRSELGSMRFNPENINYSSVVEENIRLITNRCKDKQIHVSTSIQNNAPVHGDKDMLNSIVRNILVNAVKFTPDNGSIHVDLKKDKGKWVLTTRDSGVGMSSTSINAILSDGEISTLGLYQEKGTGMGLKLCKDFIEAHNGELSISSESGNGTTVSVILPC